MRSAPAILSKLSSRTLIALATATTLGTIAVPYRAVAQSDLQAFCDAYATAAVESQEEQVAAGCKFQGGRWSSDKNLHLKACLDAKGAPNTYTMKEMNQRAEDLASCKAKTLGVATNSPLVVFTTQLTTATMATFCANYAKIADLQQRDRVRMGCGAKEFSGRWDSDPQRHDDACRSWGANAGRNSAREMNGRESDILTCKKDKRNNGPAPLIVLPDSPNAPVGGRGDAAATDRCPTGEVMVGVRFRAGDWMDQITVACAAVGPNLAPGNSKHYPFPARGGNGGNGPTEIVCPGSALLPITALDFSLTAENRQVRHIKMTCSSGQVFEFGGPAASSNNGSQHPVQKCSTGEVAVGLGIRYGVHVNALGLLCGKIAAPVQTSGSGPGTGQAPTCAPNVGDPVPAEWKDMLAAHNERRKLHCVCPLSWSNQLAAGAGTWASQCILDQHGIAGGENMADHVFVTTSASGVTTPILPAESDRAAYEDTWYCENKNYPDYTKDPASHFLGGFTSDCGQGNNRKVTGHFTQVVWKDTRRVGCARASCTMTIDLKDKNGNIIQKNFVTQGTHWVCRYDPPGDTATDNATLKSEVLAPTCK